MITNPPSYSALILRAIKSTAVRFPFVLVVFFFYLAASNYFLNGRSVLETYERFVAPVEILSFKLPLFIWIIFLFFASAPIDSIYWYFRERNPSYIRKMEEIERLKQEKAAAKRKDQSGGDSV